MTRTLLAGGSLAALMGTALFVPVVVARLEGSGLTSVAVGIAAAGCILIACGVTAAGVGFWRRRASVMPSGVRVAVAVNILILGFLALELSDRLVRQDGRINYWTTFLLPPALLLFGGLVAARPWAWWTYRGATALAVLWFLGLVAVIPFGDLHGPGGPVPWYGRAYMIGVSLAFAGILAAAFWSLGRPETRGYFGLLRPAGGATAEPGATPDGGG